MLVKIIFVLSFIFVPFLLSFVINFLYLRFFKKIKRKKGQLGKILKSNFLKKIYWEFPQRFVKDWLQSDPSEFVEVAHPLKQGLKPITLDNLQ